MIDTFRSHGPKFSEAHQILAADMNPVGSEAAEQRVAVLAAALTSNHEARRWRFNQSVCDVGCFLASSSEGPPPPLVTLLLCKCYGPGNEF